MPLQRRLPKRGFNNPFRVEYAVVNVGQLDRLFAANEVVDLDSLRAKRLIRTKQPLVKVLAKGQLSKPLTVKAHKFSAAARTQLEAAGGTAEVIPGA
jgi:large subunit ribosomal protein L15